MAFDPNDPKDKELLDEAVNKAVASATAGLISKRDELLAEVKSLKGTKTQLSEAEQKLAAIEEEKLRKAGEWEKLEADLRAKATAKEAEYQAQLEAKQKNLESLLIDNGLKEQLIKANVKKEFIPAVEALLRGKVSLADLDGTLSAVVDGKRLNDFIGEWAKSDEGKAFVLAPENSGGGASGGTRSVDNKKFDEMTDAERIQLHRENPEKYNSVVAEYKSRT